MADLIVEPSGPLRGELLVPGDKSITHRALILAPLAEGETRIEGWVQAEVCLATRRCMEALGARYVDLGFGALRVRGEGPGGLHEAADVLHCAGSGTTIRLLSGLAAGLPYTTVLTGADPLRRRPMGRVAEPLRRMGATVVGREGGRLPPLTVCGGGLRAISYPMPVASAQVKSAILLAALFASGATEVLEPSPSRDHTERMLREFGVEVVSNGLTVRVAGGQALRAPAGPIVIPADFSSAAFPLVAAAIVSGSDVRLPLVGANPTRTGLFDLLLEMGARVSMSGRSASAEPTATFSSRGSALRGVLVSGETVVRAIDEFPILAIAATQAQGDTVIRDAGELRVKESDRIASVAAELRKMGASIDETADGMIVHGRAQLRGAVVEAHRDHRLAMALAVAGLAADGETIVRGAEAIGDSFPSFVEDMQRLGARIHWCEGADQGAGAGGSND